VKQRDLTTRDAIEKVERIHGREALTIDGDFEDKRRRFRLNDEWVVEQLRDLEQGENAADETELRRLKNVIEEERNKIHKSQDFQGGKE